MGTFRHLLTAAVAPALLAAGGATAAPCSFIRDVKGDADSGDAAHDLVAADIAGDGRTLTATLRLVDLVADSGTTASAAYRLAFALTGTSTTLSMTAYTTANGVTARAVASDGGGLGGRVAYLPAVATFDPKAETVRITFRSTELPDWARVEKGTRLGPFRALTIEEHVNVALPPPVYPTVPVAPASGFVVDDARRDEPYVVGTAACRARRR